MIEKKYQKIIFETLNYINRQSDMKFIKIENISDDTNCTSILFKKYIDNKWITLSLNIEKQNCYYQTYVSDIDYNPLSNIRMIAIADNTDSNIHTCEYLPISLISNATIAVEIRIYNGDM